MCFQCQMLEEVLSALKEGMLSFDDADLRDVGSNQWIIPHLFQINNVQYGFSCRDGILLSGPIVVEIDCEDVCFCPLRFCCLADDVGALVVAREEILRFREL